MKITKQWNTASKWRRLCHQAGQSSKWRRFCHQAGQLIQQSDVKLPISSYRQSGPSPTLRDLLGLLHQSDASASPDIPVEPLAAMRQCGNAAMQLPAMTLMSSVPNLCGLTHHSSPASILTHVLANALLSTLFMHCCLCTLYCGWWLIIERDAVSSQWYLSDRC